MGVSDQLTCPNGFYEPPPPEEGYLHLAYAVAQMMSLRDEIEQGRRATDAKAANDISRWIKVADHLGCFPESWKLRDVMLRKFPDLYDHQIEELLLFYRSRCDYSLIMKALSRRFALG